MKTVFFALSLASLVLACKPGQTKSSSETLEAGKSKPSRPTEISFNEFKTYWPEANRIGVCTFEFIETPSLRGVKIKMPDGNVFNVKYNVHDDANPKAIVQQTFGGKPTLHSDAFRFLKSTFKDMGHIEISEVTQLFDTGHPMQLMRLEAYFHRTEKKIFALSVKQDNLVAVHVLQDCGDFKN